MKQAFKFVRFDLATVAPYGRVFLILGVIMLFVTIGNNQPISTVVVFSFMAILTTSYPFAVADRNGLETLYATLPLSRHTIVNGRYLGAVSGFLGFLVLSILVTLGLCAGKGIELDLPGLGAMIGIGAFIFALAISIQFPLYFHLGYSRAQLAIYIPIFGIAGVILILGLVFPHLAEGFFAWSAGSPVLLIALLIVAAATLLIVSAAISRKVYGTKDL